MLCTWISQLVLIKQFLGEIHLTGSIGLVVQYFVSPFNCCS